MNIFFAWSIRWNPQWTHIYPIIIEQLKNHGTVLSELFLWSHNTAIPNPYTSDHQIFEQDIALLDQADIIVAEVTGPSHGCGREICYGQYVRQIPIICLHLEDSNPSAMLRGNDYLDIYTYNENNISEVLQTAFSNIKLP